MTSKDSPSISNCKVLIVDGEPEIREAVTAMLEELGVTDVDLAVDGQAALDMLGTETPDVVLLDLMMPRKDGFDVLRDLRNGGAGHRPAHVVVMSAYMEGEAVSESRSLGADRVLQKPFRLDKLEQALGMSA